VQLLFKIAITHLLEDVGVPCLVDLEGFVAVGADDFVHGEWDSSCWLDWYLPEHTGPYAAHSDCLWDGNPVAGIPINAWQTACAELRAGRH
jgi:hypothetical protein